VNVHELESVFFLLRGWAVLGVDVVFPFVLYQSVIMKNRTRDKPSPQLQKKKPLHNLPDRVRFFPPYLLSHAVVTLICNLSS
jgi:hypothetical protein